MTSTQFIQWLADVKAAGLAKSDAGCARLLGFDPHAVVAIKKNGTDTRTALACAAVLAQLKPYGASQ